MKRRMVLLLLVWFGQVVDCVEDERDVGQQERELTVVETVAPSYLTPMPAPAVYPIDCCPCEGEDCTGREPAGNPYHLTFKYAARTCDASEEMCVYDAWPAAVVEAVFVVATPELTNPCDSLHLAYFAGFLQKDQELTLYNQGADFDEKTNFFLYDAHTCDTLYQQLKIDLSCKSPLKVSDHFASVKLDQCECG